MHILVSLLAGVVIGAGAVYFYNNTERNSVLTHMNGLVVPFGAAKVSGYYVTGEGYPGPDGSTSGKTCHSFVITDGPDALLADYMAHESVGTVNGNPVLVLGDSTSNLSASIKASTVDSTIDVVAISNPVQEGGLYGCMSWPIEAIYPVE